jgi:hypothetical protein
MVRGWVCRLQLLLGLASAVILKSDSRRTHHHILLSQIRDSPNCLILLGTDHHFQHNLYCCALIRCCGDVAQIISVGTCLFTKHHTQ